MRSEARNNSRLTCASWLPSNVELLTLVRRPFPRICITALNVIHLLIPPLRTAGKMFPSVAIPGALLPGKCQPMRNLRPGR